MELDSFLVTLLLVVLRLFCVTTTTFAVVHNDTIRSTDVLRDHNSINALLVSKTLLVSKEGRFALGFFNPTGGFFNHRYLGIWYNNITSYSDVVWVANRCEPIIVTSGLLSIDNRGNLVLSSEENDNKREVVWSTNSSKQAAKPLVQLLDNGNLVLRDEKDDNTTNYLWESFDYPTDSLLPGMKLGWDLRRGLNRRLSSWKSSDDPCHGNFTYGIEFDEELHTYPQLIARNGTAIFYRQGMWDSISSSQNSGYEFVYNDDEVFYIQNNKSMISRIVMKDDGSIEHQDWRENFYSLIWPGDQCDSYGFCGANSQCNVTDITQDYGICYCLKGFKQKNQEQWSEGCERLYSPASCHDEEKEEFREYLGMRVPDTKNSLVSKSNNASECESKCLTNCTCMAYSFTYSESNVFVADTVCVLWFGDLFDIRQLPSGGGGGQTTHIRIPNSKIVLYKCSGYMAPEYVSNGLFSIKSDVFSFGTLVLEIVSGKKSRSLYDEDSLLNLNGLAWTLMKEGNAFKLIEKCLLSNPYMNIEEALRCIHIGLLCVQQKRNDRPNMSSVVQMLSDKSILPQPKPPAYFSNTDLWEGAHSSVLKPPSCNTSITTVEGR
ncbi:hypothetical protein CsatB_027986 [Cannabis sativa]